RGHSELFEERVDVRIDLDDAARLVLRHRLRRLQARAGDENDDTVALSDLAGRSGGAQRADGDADGGLAEDAGELCEERHVRSDLVLRDRVDRAAGGLRGPDGEIAVGGVPDRERLRDRVRADRADTPVLRVRGRDG